MLHNFGYNSHSVSFRNEGNSVFINATQMAKLFGKQPSDWLRLKATEEFLDAIYQSKNLPVAHIRATADNQHVISSSRKKSPVRGIPRTADNEYFTLDSSQKTKSDDLIQVLQGGNIQGTWMHEDVAMEFARWLSPSFAIWCNDRIKELLRHGITATDAKLEDMLANPDLVIGLATQLKNERAAKELLQQQVFFQAQSLEQSAPKVKYHDSVLCSVSLIATNVIAKELGMSAITLNKLLNQMQVIYRQGDTWVLYSRFQNKGYTGTKTSTYQDSLGYTKTSIHTYWTEAGRLFIHNVIEAYNKRSANKQLPSKR